MRKNVGMVLALALTLLVSLTPVYAEDINNPIINDTQTKTGQLTEAPKDSPGGLTQAGDKHSTDNYFDYFTEGDGDPITEEETASAIEEVKPKRDYAGELFGDVTLDIDHSAAKPMNAWLRGIVSIVMSVIMGIFPSLMILNTAIDVMCIAFKPVMTIFATMIPFQCFSSEVTEVTGIPFAGDKNQTPAVATDLGNQNKLVYYLKKRGTVAFFALLMFVLMASGLWFKLMGFIVNWIVGFLVSVV